LPVGNQASQAVGGDLTGTTGAAVVAPTKLFTAKKAGDQTVASSTVLVNETSLAVPMLASDFWVVTWALYCTFNGSAGGADGIQLAVTVPVGATLAAMYLGACVSAGASGASDADFSTTSGGGVAMLQVAALGTTSGVITVTANVAVGGMAGNITLQFAQNVSSATAAAIKSGSCVTAIRH
jgi:hypothetical protein